MEAPHPTLSPQPVVIDPAKNRRVAAMVAGGFCVMLGASFAAVPLYDLFCRVTGFGGTPMIASAAPAETGTREFTIRFDANVAAGLGWRFEPEMETVTIRVGEVRTVGYRLRNMREVATTGIASFNVTPEQTGAFFNKITCFCFTEQTLQPGETRVEEVVFFIDPAIVRERELESIQQITLSYTFFPVRNAARPLANAGVLTTSSGGAPAAGSN
ncbi:MAG: cytochrome c oxidase assembly protein [Hyphomicrobiales bacterium]|uniref:cytochrome c oxidase assembly protein n=1 Tax=Rhabdaerophilum calidifontis TaxID=2604328 RepID=UPI00123B23A2|nr:cytochrome c oxidase assembly protein [Rhabdaerophilum calidifontis]MCA1999380.1 cytochrome c oxidase assembly protein [Hyphomicrobiales bacterium]